MGINGVSNISAIDSSFRFGGATNTNDSSVTAIERRIEALEQSIDDVESNDQLSSEERKKRIEQYQQQIQQLQMQKQQMIQEHEKEARERQQAEMKAKMEEQQKQQPRDEEHPEREAQKISDDTMDAMTSISTAMDMHSCMSVLRTKMMSEARVTGAEAKMDASRGMDTSAKDEQVADTNDAINNLTTRIVKNLNDTATNLQDVTISDAKQKAETRKNINSTVTKQDESENATDQVPFEEEKRQERIRITEDGRKQNATLPEGYYPVDVYK